jgi:hypothetical protein
VIAYLDCSTGVSGDKFLGALLDAGETSGSFTAEDLRAVARELAPEARVEVARVRSHGIAAVSVRVEATEQPPSRTWASIRDQLHAADLPSPVRERALRAFEALATAEAAAHGTPVDEVHFHEVGALDSLVDVVGACAGVHALEIEWLLASPVATGSGTVKTAHGTLPVPAPATAALLIDVPTVAGPAEGELTTPTGAALLDACASGYGVSPPMVPQLVGYGAGTRDIGMPNVCRIVIGESETVEVPLRTERVTLLETNIDHVSPEAAAVALDQLLAEGALDAWLSPIVMKKGRSAFTLSALVASELAEPFAERIIALTGTLGVRRREIERFVAEREQREVTTPYGVVRFKIGPVGARPEADDVARIARETGRSFGEVEREIGDLLGESG